MNNPILNLEGASKSFITTNGLLTVLHETNLKIPAGETCAIMGPSGSGKSTLLGICAGLDTPSTGKIYLLDKEITSMNDDEKGRMRNRYVGFIFQNFQLLPSFTALENVLLPLEIAGEKADVSRAQELLAQVGLAERQHHYPTQLSGGEQQRVAIARAFINNPKILFADEPTGNLDADTGALIQELIFDLNRAYHTTLVLVTHDKELASKTDKIYTIKAGRLSAQ